MAAYRANIWFAMNENFQQEAKEGKVFDKLCTSSYLQVTVTITTELVD